jgi:integrase
MFRDDRGRWWIDYHLRDAEGKLRRHKKLCGKTKESAERILRTVRVSVDEGKYIDPFQSPRFSEYVKNFRETSDKVSHQKAGARFDRLIAFFGHLKLSAITPKYIERYQRDRKENGKGRGGKTQVMPATINRETQLLRSILGKAVRQGELAKNPALSVKDHGEGAQRERFLTRSETLKLMQATKQSNSPLLRAVVCLAMETGLRKSEIFNLKWDDIKFESGQLLVTKSKTNKQRHVPLSRRARWLLSKRAASNPLATYVFESENRDGKPAPLVDCKKAWHTALVRAGISNFRFHDLRHCFASNFAMSGGNVHALAKILGHANPVMTLGRYAHLSGDYIREQAAFMDRKPRESEGSGYRMDTERVSGEKEDV